MTTMVLSAAGAAIGGAVGGSVLGLSSVAIGRFAGAMIGNAIDQRILGTGGGAVETGRIDRYRITGSAEGRSITQLYGRMRLSGHVIWASKFQEHAQTSGGGKGAPSSPQRTEYRYSVSMALGLCEGEITGITRVWADGREVAMSDLNMRVYDGRADQLPDPKMEAIEGVGTVPAYRGMAYVVFEDLDLGPFGNRIPQLSFEVSRPSPAKQRDADIEPTRAIRAVALIPGSGEYALATEPVYQNIGLGQSKAVNVNAPSNQADFVTAMQALDQDLPNCDAVSLVVSWFGNDLRCGQCEIQPKVEHKLQDASAPWRVSTLTRSTAQNVPLVDGRAVYGGTPTDDSVIQAIRHLNSAGKDVMFYPFVLMDQQEGNDLADPWSDEATQPALPWRGRITLSKAPGIADGPDQTAAAAAEVAAFFGTAVASDFLIADGAVTYAGPQEWRFRRYILHQAALCAAAGGVEAFCIGSEMRGMTWIRDHDGAFVAVDALVDLLHEVRTLLGPNVKLTYAADWSEYFGYQPQDGSGDRYFHLDALWADPDLDFIGVDNYLPVSDWRDEGAHADQGYGRVHALNYLKDNIEGGEGYDWYYHSDQARAAQIRTPIDDGAYNEAWVFRNKDFRNWWQHAHFDRINGVRQEQSTGWVPKSKPIRFTELGCAAIDKGSNQPNKFLDPKSSESRLPVFSNGHQDDFLQHQFLKAHFSYWAEAANNPISEIYEAEMIDMSKAYIWAWDTRPFPRFPRENDVWSDGENYARGHWISGRTSHRSLASVVREICHASGVHDIDVDDLVGMVPGFLSDGSEAPRAQLQQLMLRYGFDAIEQGGVLRFLMRGASVKAKFTDAELAVTQDLPTGARLERQSQADAVGRVRLNAVEAIADFDTISEEAIFADEPTTTVASSEVNLALQRGEARQVVERWLAEARLAKDRVTFALPLSRSDVGVGDVVALPVAQDAGSAEDVAPCYRIDRMEIADSLQCEGVRVSAQAYLPGARLTETSTLPVYSAPVPVTPVFMDLPLIIGEEPPHRPRVIAVGDPWPGTVAVYHALGDSDFALNTTLARRPTVGVLQTEMPAGDSGVWDRGAGCVVQMISGTLENVDQALVLEGANLAAVGDGTPDGWEIIQFATAELVGPKTYLISRRLRGQAGTDGLAQGAWPVGSWFVMLNGAAEHLELPMSARDLMRTYRVGPANRPVSDPVYQEQSLAFKGNGLRPYKPVHLRARQQVNGDIEVRWVRRTRIGGDGWLSIDVPLGEEAELYRLDIVSGGAVVKSELISAPGWSLSATQKNALGLSGLVEFHVSQMSALYGAGPQARVSVNVA